MSVTVADIQTFAPLLADVDEDTIQAAIDEAERNTYRTAWGARADDGIKNLTAHLLTVNEKLAALASAQVTGPITSQGVGPLSRSFAVAAAVPYEHYWYTLTTYGQRYLTLVGSIFANRVC